MEGHNGTTLAEEIEESAVARSNRWLWRPPARIGLTCLLVSIVLATPPLSADEKCWAGPVAAPTEAATDLEPKIVGGSEAIPGKYPFQVALILASTPEGEEFSGQFCGGSLVDDRWVLTAAHCVDHCEPVQFDAYLGATVLPDGDGTSMEAVRLHLDKIIVHDDYDSDTSDNDIALLKLVGPAPPELGKTKLASAEDEAQWAFEGADVRVIGWGRTSEGGMGSASLMQVEVQMQNKEVCDANYSDVLPGSDHITENMFCAGVSEGGKDSCQGDSGGFLGAHTGFGDYVQLGVVSWGIGCARKDLFGVYTRVSKYTESNWISDVISEN